MENWRKDWKVISILNLRGANQKMDEEIDYFIDGCGNDSARLLWLGDEDSAEDYPNLTKFLLDNGYEKGSQILMWVSW